MCERWRDVARLAWQTRKCIRISVNTFPDDQMLNTMITRKHIGHALTRFELNVENGIRRHLSFTALAQHCPNIEHLNIRQVYSLVNNI